jgi:small subunit ribosomal protein S1
MAAADAEAALPTSYTSVAGAAAAGEDEAEGAPAAEPRPAPAASGGTLASDEALQALREKLSGGGA